MKNSVRPWFLCLVLFAGCGAWNQPIISKIEGRLDELRAIHTIFVSAAPGVNTFIAGEDEVPRDAETWAGDYGLEVCGINSFNEILALTPGTEYTVGPVELKVPEKEPLRVPVTVKLNNPGDITTGFWITLLRPDAEYYRITPYTDPAGIGTVSADPSLITGDQFDEAGEGGVHVSITVSPSEAYTLTDGSLAYSLTDPGISIENKNPLLPEDGIYIFKKDFFEKQEEKKYRTYLYAEFEGAYGVVMLDGLYYASLKGAVDAMLGADPPRSEAAIEVVTGFTIRDAAEIPGGKKITLKSEGGAVKTVTGDITVENGGTLRLASAVPGALNVSGRIELKGDAVLELAGAVSVNEVVLGNMPITVSGALSPSGGIAVKKIIAGKKSQGDLVFTGVRPEDRDKFIVDGWALEWDGDKGRLAQAAAGQWVNGNENYYVSIQDAVDASNGSAGSPDTITVLTDINVGSTQAVTITGKHVKLVPKTGATVTLTRASNFAGSLFNVESGGSLTLTGDGSTGQLVINGNNVTASGRLVNVSGGVLTINNGVTLLNNNDGGVYVSGGTFTMSGGTISGNTAAEDGGGVYVSGGTFTMSGGTISGNTAAEDGGGVYLENGAFTMSGPALVSQNNDVYLADGKWITVGTLDAGSTPAAKITPENTVNGTVVLTADAGATLDKIDRFTLWSGGYYIYLDGGAGKISAPKTVSVGSYDVLKDEAIKHPNGGTIDHPVTIILTGDITIDSADKAITLAGGRHIKLVPDISSHSIKRGASGFGSLFTVESGASLTLEGSGANKLIIDGGTVLTYNGSANRGLSATGALITVNGGTLAMNAGAALQNNYVIDNSNIPGGGLYIVNGYFTLAGGAITGNSAARDGGGVYIHNTVFNMTGGIIGSNYMRNPDANGGGMYISGTSRVTFSGGEISNNYAASLADHSISADWSRGGGGIMLDDGNFTMSGAASIKNNKSAASAGGISIDKGQFVMTGGEISGNTAAKYGGGVLVQAAGTFTKTGGTVYGSNGGSNANTATDGGAALCKANGTVTTNTGVTDTTNSTF